MVNLNNSFSLVLMLASTLAVHAAPSPGYGYNAPAPQENHVVYETKVVYHKATKTVYANQGEATHSHKYGHKNYHYRPAPKKNYGHYEPPKVVQPPKVKTPAPKPSPKPAPKPSPKPAPKPAPSKSAPTSSLGKGMLEGHNSLRAQYGASPLKWSDKLASSAQEHANKCVFEHSGTSGYGENIAGGSDILGVCDMWGKDEAANFGGHFTQMVWKSTTSVGCARVQCPGQVIGDVFTVCQYEPAGNVQGAYPENVQGYQG